MIDEKLKIIKVCPYVGTLYGPKFGDIRATIVARFREAEHDPGDVFEITKTRRIRRILT